MDINAKDVMQVLGLVGLVVGYFRHKSVQQVAVDAKEELTAAVMAEVEHAVLSSDPDAEASHFERLLREAAEEAADRLHIPTKVAAPFIRLAVQRGITEVRRRIADFRAKWALPRNLDAMNEAVQKAARAAELQTPPVDALAEWRAPAGADATVDATTTEEPASRASEAPKAPPTSLPSGTPES